MSNPAFNSTDAERTDTTTGEAIDARADTTSGVPPETPNRYFLATFTYSGQTAGGQPAAGTTFSIGRRNAGADDTFTATGTTSLDSQIMPGTFTVNVIPEPSVVASLGLLGLGLVSRRRRPCLV